MKRKKILLILALLCMAMQGAWAQNEWDAVYTQTQTTSANWTALDAGSTTGNTLYLIGGGSLNANGGFGGAASNIGTDVAAARAAAGLAAKYYDLQGRRLSQPSRAGVYINMV